MRNIIKRQDNKGQAAMEFLMTYGWAILAAIIAIGVLAYFGVFSPGKFVPSASVINAPLYANAWNIVDGAGDGLADILSVEIKNNGGDTITVTDFTVNNVAVGGTAHTCAALSAADLTGCSADLKPGAVCTVAYNCIDATPEEVKSGDTVKADIAVKYTKTPGGLPLSSSGTFASTVIA